MPHPVGESLRRLARWVVAASLGVPSCVGYYDGPSTPPQDIDVPQVAVQAARTDVWQPIPCTDYWKNTFAKPVQLRRPVEYLAIYTSHWTQFFDDDGPTVSLLASVGTMCAKATERRACDLRLSKLLVPNPACSRMPRDCKTFAVITQGNEARRIEDDRELMHVLGAIDAPEKAVIVALFHGVFLPCGSRPEDNTAQLKHPDDWYLQVRWDACPGLRERTLQIDDAGHVVADNDVKLADTNCVVGRRPAGLKRFEPPHSASALGRYFVRLAQLEAASVCAFERIAAELRAFGAPDELALAADAAARDEVRHAHQMAALARRSGADPSSPQVEARSLRSRFEFALDNAVEGCVRETFGAVLAHCQAALARDPAVAVTMARIAEDETRHAELAWQIAEWITPQLSIEERGALAAAQAAALAQLGRTADQGLNAAERRVVGWPADSAVSAARERLVAICAQSGVPGRFVTRTTNLAPPSRYWADPTSSSTPYCSSLRYSVLRSKPSSWAARVLLPLSCLITSSV